ncbi:MAG: HIRAN domain-containing protein [Burkholderiales bacterium]|nr:HIRAN domain-containing protein [Burkholderiales bacterium]MDP3715781.1 HIRAN domain-containing protein [Burkholderiales bacterium]
MAFPLPFLALLAALAAPAAAADARIIVQESPLAGFQYYEGKALWDMMRVGDALQLVREPRNPHDANAVRIEWRGEMLGYLPRRENTDVARQMDLGAPVKARVVRLTDARNPWHRVRFEVYVELAPVAKK